MRVVWVALATLAISCSSGRIDEPEDASSEDVVVPDAGVDAGPVESDAGPVESDAGPVDAGPICTNCAGCCVNGECKVGSAHAACGHGGGTCQVCSGREACNGTCQLTCDDTTCPNGCCSEGRCVGGTDVKACGPAGGQSCEVCGGDLPLCKGTPRSCKNSCDVTTCPRGCCQGTVCHTEEKRAACGYGGVACAVCPETSECIRPTTTNPIVYNCQPKTMAKVSMLYLLEEVSENSCINNCRVDKQMTIEAAEDLVFHYEACELVTGDSPEHFKNYVFGCPCVEGGPTFPDPGQCCTFVPEGANHTTCSWTPP